MLRFFAFTLFSICLPTALMAQPGDAMASLDQQLAGSWVSQDGKIEEHWTTAKGGLMVGLNRNASRPGTPFFEFMRIEQRGDTVFLVAHPKGAPGSDFKLVQLTQDSAVFENAAHDFPQVIIYERKGENELCAAIGTLQERRKVTWCWVRGSLTPAP